MSARIHLFLYLWPLEESYGNMKLEKKKPSAR